MTPIPRPVRLSIGVRVWKDLVVFDTVNRWMLGNDQDSQAVGAFLRNCTNIVNEFGCSVLLVHHTGVSRDSQDRHRGSGAWRAGLEGFGCV